jgi:hypothetical protein
MMDFLKKFGRTTKGEGGAWIQPMHPMFNTPSPPSRPFPLPPPERPL